MLILEVLSKNVFVQDIQEKILVKTGVPIWSDVNNKPVKLIKLIFFLFNRSRKRLRRDSSKSCQPSLRFTELYLDLCVSVIQLKLVKNFVGTNYGFFITVFFSICVKILNGFFITDSKEATSRNQRESQSLLLYEGDHSKKSEVDGKLPASFTYAGKQMVPLVNTIIWFIRFVCFCTLNYHCNRYFIWFKQYLF